VALLPPSRPAAGCDDPCRRHPAHHRWRWMKTAPLIHVRIHDSGRVVYTLRYSL